MYSLHYTVGQKMSKFCIFQKTFADICVVHNDSGRRTEQHIIIGFGELFAVILVKLVILEYIDIRSVC